MKITPSMLQWKKMTCVLYATSNTRHKKYFEFWIVCLASAGNTGKENHRQSATPNATSRMKITFFDAPMKKKTCVLYALYRWSSLRHAVQTYLPKCPWTSVRLAVCDQYDNVGYIFPHSIPQVLDIISYTCESQIGIRSTFPIPGGEDTVHDSLSVGTES